MGQQISQEPEVHNLESVVESNDVIPQTDTPHGETGPSQGDDMDDYNRRYADNMESREIITIDKDGCAWVGYEEYNPYIN